MIYLLIGYMWLFIHRPFEVWPILGTIHLERVYVAACVVYWLLLQTDKTRVSNRLNLAFTFFWLVLTMAYVTSPFRETDQCSETYQNYLKAAVLYPLVATTVRDEKQLKLLTGGFLVAFALYMTHSLREFRNGRYVFRMGIVRMIGVDLTSSDPNSFASSILYALTIALAFWPVAKNRKERLFLAYYTGLSVLCVVLTGSRSGMVGLGCIMLFTFRRLLRSKGLLLLVLGAIPIGWFLMEERLQNRFWTLIDPSVGPANAQQSAEGRLQGFYDGLENWQRSPVTGVGPGAHGLATGLGYQPHNLYGQVLGETGALGALGLLCIVVGILANAWEARGLRRRLGGEVGQFPAGLSYSVVMATMILLVKGYSDHNLYRYNWIWFGAFQAIAVHCLRDRYRRESNDPIQEEDSPDWLARLGNPSDEYV